VLCEQEVTQAFPDALIIRPGVVAGPHDGSERFGYWVRRAAQGGRLLGPPRPDQPVQVVHAGDQARFIVERIAAGAGGVFDSVGECVSFSTLLDSCAKAAGTDITVGWAPQQLLRDNHVALPLALSPSGRWDGAFSRRGQRAAEAGFVNRPLVDTATETLAWERTRDPATFHGLSATEEAALLAAL
jgi:2'-hydroxyisoflavone reductase